MEACSTSPTLGVSINNLKTNDSCMFLVWVFLRRQTVNVGRGAHVPAVQPRGGNCAKEELAAIGVGTSIGHAENTRASVLELEVLIRKLLAIDRLPSGPVAPSKVSTWGPSRTMSIRVFLELSSRQFQTELSPSQPVSACLSDKFATLRIIMHAEQSNALRSIQDLGGLGRRLNVNVPLPGITSIHWHAYIVCLDKRWFSRSRDIPLAMLCEKVTPEEGGKRAPWIMKLGIMRWKPLPLNPYPWEPVQSSLKFLAVFGTSSPAQSNRHAEALKRDKQPSHRCWST